MDEKISEIERFRDRYLIENPTVSSAYRNKLVREQCLLLLQEVTLPSETVSKAKFNLLCGKIWNIVPNYEPSGEDYLSKAVKLDPMCTESWNELGDCLWKKGDVSGAKNCFEVALQKSRNPTSLRNLAMIMRREECSGVEERGKLIKTSLDYAKEASELNPNDADNFYSLGNAYLAYFFACGQQNSSFIESALKAYENAIKLEGEDSLCADLHFNYAQALLYEQRYAEALNSLSQASRLDPEFTEASTTRRNLTSFLRQCHEFVVKKGKLKPKRFRQILDTIEPRKDLGPYAGGTFTSSNGKSVSLREIPLGELSEGSNPNRIVVGRVVGFVISEDTIPYTFILADASMQCSVVTVYNFSPKFGVVIGNSVAIPEPFVIDVDFKVDEEEFKFRVLRIPNPLVLALNGKKISSNNAAMVEISLTS